MGLYSINKVASVAESVEDAVLNEAEEIMRELDECSYDSNFGDIMEVAIQLHENDKKMFDALIECDFISAVNESVMLEADAEEANKGGNATKLQKIGYTIQRVIQNFIELLKKAAQNAIAKIIDLVKNDKKLVAGFRKTLTLPNLKGFKGISDFAFPSGKMLSADDLTSEKDAVKFVTDFMSKAYGTADKEEMDKLYNEFIEEIKEREKFNNDYASVAFEKPEPKWVPTSNNQLGAMVDAVENGSVQIKAIKNHAAKVIGILKSIESSAKRSLSTAKKNKEEDVYILNKIYSATTETCRYFSKEFKIFTKVTAQQIAAYRKAAIICGRYAAKVAKGGVPSTETDSEEKSANESMIMWALGESSDVYVQVF